MTRISNFPRPSSRGDGSRPRTPSPARRPRARPIRPSSATSTASSPAGWARKSSPASIRPVRCCPSAQDMCARFSVSRTALREAYSILSAKGLIVARPKIGTRVRPKAEWNLLDPEVLAWHLAATPSEHLVDELFALRQMVEPPASALAASSPSRDTVAADRRRLRPNGAVQERRGRPDRRRPRLPHGDPRSVREPVSGGARRAHPHRARMHFPAELARRRRHPGQSPLSASRDLRGDPRRRPRTRSRADGRAAAGLDRRRARVPAPARRSGRPRCATR